MIKASYTHLYIFVYKGVKGNLTLILIYFEFSSVKSCGLAEMVTEDILEGKNIGSFRRFSRYPHINKLLKYIALTDFFSSVKS